jgi:tRNA (guanine-N7-)-methyltransferase
MREHRSRAHINPLNDTFFPFPLNPDYVDWRIHYPKAFDCAQNMTTVVATNTRENPIHYNVRIEDGFNGKARSVDFLDVGCGYGGLLFALHDKFPEKLVLGMEIRDKLVDYIGKKILAMRIEQDKCHTVGVVRTNAMRHLC